MNAYLVRVGIDITPESGGWVAPVDPETHSFAYVPIVEKEAKGKKPIRTKYGTTYDEFKQVCDSLGVELPQKLVGQKSHLDPDFKYLTYGDEDFRGRPLQGLVSGDVLAFYAALRPVKPCIVKLIYALIGLYVVDRVMSAKAVPEKDWHKNAHTRRKPDDTDIVVFGKEGLSGRLERCIPIGGWRYGAYRVTEELLHDWGGLKVSDGWIQRSAVLPWFCDPQKFYDWFKKKKIALVSKNN
ncbi:MAG: hypothetical protein FJ013_04470 [Chloroflexi bacterium]|nr:hypothetical protein [Chloroflexota bacterium]